MGCRNRYYSVLLHTADNTAIIFEVYIYQYSEVRLVLYIPLDSPAMLAEEHGADGHSEYYCPITFELMDDPVVLADGTTYDRVAIERWLQTHSTSPLTGEFLPHAQLIPNRSLSALISEFRDHRPNVATRRRVSATIQDTHRPTEHVVPMRATRAMTAEPAAMTSADARGFLCRHVKSGWTTDTTAASYCEITSCTTVSTVVTGIDSFVETRERVPAKVPYVSCPISARSDGIAPDIWDIQCRTQPLFVTAEERIEIPHTSHLRACYDCKGLCTMQCKTCNGEMNRWCTSCPSGASDGNNSTCTACKGSKLLPCNTCERGKTDCSNCQGLGEFRHYEELLRKHKVMPSARCTEVAISDRDLSSWEICAAAGTVIYSDEAPTISCPRDFSDEVNRNLLLIENESAVAVQKIRTSGGRLIRQKLSIRRVPITFVKANYQGQKFHWYIYGTANSVVVYNYPNNCCEFCNRCSVS